MKWTVALALAALACAVTATPSTWATMALKKQQALAFNNVTLDKYAPACTHASANTLEYYPSEVRSILGSLVLSGKVILHSQSLNVTEQLNSGIRRLELGVHYVSAISAEPIICDAFPEILQLCSLLGATNPNQTCTEALGLPDYAEHTGCSPFSPLASTVFNTIGQWLNQSANANEVVILHLGNYINASVSSNLANALIGAFGSKLAIDSDIATFKTNHAGAYPTPGQLVALGKNVMAFMTPTPSYPEYGTAQVTVTTTLSSSSVKDFSSCPVSPVSFDVYYEDLRMVKYDLFGYSADIEQGVTVGNYTSSLVESVRACQISACVDQLNQAKLDSFVWSFAYGNGTQSCDETKLCVAATVNGWINDDCAQFHHTACYNPATQVWSATNGINSGTSLSPCSSPYVAAVPTNARQAEDLKTFLASNSNMVVWLPGVMATFSSTLPDYCTQPQVHSAATTITAGGLLALLCAVALAFFQL